MEADILTPYAVYGTLRSGEANARLWRGLGVSIGLGQVDGYRLVTNGGFPYALPSEGDSIVIEMIAPHDAIAGEVMRERLDHLEGYPTFYDRLVVPVGLEEPAAGIAWMYVPASDHQRLGRLAPVPGNDWSMRYEEEAFIA